MYLFPKLYQKGRISELFPQYFSLFFFPFNKTIVLFLLIGSLIFMDIFSLPFLRNRLIPRTKRAISEFPLLLYISFFLFTKNNCLFLFCFLLIFCHSSSFFSVYISGQEQQRCQTIGLLKCFLLLFFSLVPVPFSGEREEVFCNMFVYFLQNLFTCLILRSLSLSLSNLYCRIILIIILIFLITLSLISSSLSSFIAT